MMKGRFPQRDSNLNQLLFLSKRPQFSRFYLSPKIHERLYDIPGRTVISNCDFYTEKIPSFLDFRLQPLVQKIKSHIKKHKSLLEKN